jgi:hypothetical protein
MCVFCSWSDVLQVWMCLCAACCGLLGAAPADHKNEGQLVSAQVTFMYRILHWLVSCVALVKKLLYGSQRCKMLWQGIQFVFGGCRGVFSFGCACVLMRWHAWC